MREFDRNGLLLAEFQGSLFEESVKSLECSSKIFLRRFLHSDLLRKLDKNESFYFSLVGADGLRELGEEQTPTAYGSKKYSPDAMFWMGYIYRYISYTRDIETSVLMNEFTPDELAEKHYVYHTQSEEWVIRSLLESHHLNEDFLNKNARLKHVMLKYIQNDVVK